MPTINIQALTVGAIAADAFLPDFTSPACAVFNTAGDFWFRGAGNKYLAATSDNNYTVTTTANYQDVEVTTWARKGEVFFRISDDGRALKVLFNEEDNSIRCYPTNFLADPPGGFEAEGNPFFTLTSWSMLSFAGYVHLNASGRSWTFGVTGFDFYIKMNGVEVAREKQAYQIKTGKVAIKAHSAGGYGFDSLTVTALAASGILSDGVLKIFDPRDYGFKALSTTGSMTAASPTLTVASATGFAIGDVIIVETGGEAGLGLRGTSGVGGQWPTLSYANAAARDADTTQVDGKWSYVVDTGLTHWWDDPGNVWLRGTGTTGATYYYDKAVPFALVATITNIVGNVITLNTNATTSTTNANVYYDCAPALNFFLVGSTWENGAQRKMSLPAGNFAVSGPWQAPTQCPWAIYGQGIDATRLFSPSGAPENQIYFYNITNGDCSCHDLELCGNFGSDGFRFNLFDPSENISRNSPPWAQSYGIGFVIANGTCYNVRSGDHSKNCFFGQYASDLAFHDCEAFDTERPKFYISWCYQIADSTASVPGSLSFTDCTFTCPKIKEAVETFRSNGVYFTRMSTTNGMYSSNGSGDFLFDECSALFQENNEPGNTGEGTDVTAYGETYNVLLSFQNPIMQVNSNIGPPLGGGVFRNPTIIIEGFSNTALGHGYPGMIIVNASCPDISVTADPVWPDRPCDAPLVNGFFSAPDYDALLNGSGGLAVSLEGERGLVDGIRVNGDPGPNGNVIVWNYPQIVQNCVFDFGVTEATGTVTETNNITVAEFQVICVGNVTPPLPQPLPEVPEMTGTLYGLPLSQQLDEDGDPHAGCLLYIYEALTTTPVDTFADFSLTTLNAYPLQADASGRIPQFWLADGAYRARLTTAGGVEIFDEDLILTIGPSTATTTSSSGSGSGSAATFDTTAIFSTGDLKWKPITGSLSGWVRANGRTVGSASSGGTERASSDTQSLYEFLWNNFTNTLCPVNTGRGASALADFAANKAIGTLDMRGYAAYGLDDMGNTAVGRLVTGTPTTAASATGAEKTTLLEANLPAHTHAAGTFAVGAHTHTAGSYSANAAVEGTNVAATGGSGKQYATNTSVSVTGTSGSTAPTFTGTSASTGSGTAATTISPGRLGSWYLKL